MDPGSSPHAVVSEVVPLTLCAILNVGIPMKFKESWQENGEKQFIPSYQRGKKQYFIPSFGNPLRLCNPSQFWLMTHFSRPSYDVGKCTSIHNVMCSTKCPHY